MELFKQKIQSIDFSKFINDESRHEILPFIENLHSFNNEFDEVIPKGYDKEEYNFVLWEIFSYYLSFEGTGIIFAGYNRNQFFPSFIEINLYFNHDGEIIYEVIESVENSLKPIIRVYANNKEAYAFLTGVGDDFEFSLNEYFYKSNENILNRFNTFLDSYNGIDLKTKKDVLTYFAQLQNDELVNKSLFIDYFKFDSIDFIAEYIENLPKNIICELVVLLINLTALKQKITPEIESVGDEVDLAIIEPFNYFEWLK